MVNNLFIMCQAQLTCPFTLYCYTDNPEGINNHIKVLEYVENDFDIVVYNKLFLFSEHINNQLPHGNRLYFDLDVVIRFNIDDICEHKHGNLCLIEAEWRRKWDYGFPVFHHPFNSSCMTWIDNQPQKLWDLVQRDPEFFMTKYRWGMDSFMFYEHKAIGVDISYFPHRKFYSFLFGVDISENMVYDPKELSYRESKLRHITAHIPVILFNGPSTPEQYNHFFNKNYKS